MKLDDVSPTYYKIPSVNPIGELYFGDATQNSKYCERGLKLKVTVGSSAEDDAAIAVSLAQIGAKTFTQGVIGEPGGSCVQYDSTNGPAWRNYGPNTHCTMPAGLMMLPISRQHRLVTMVRLTTTSTTVPIARSYDGQGWESIHRDFPMIRFSSQKSQVNIPNDGHTYQLRGTDMSQQQMPSTRVSAARFLMQATFGPTHAEVRSFTNPAQWIRAQMALPASYVRARWRNRINPRAITDGGLRAGAPKGACDVGSYWNRYAFNKRDLYKTIEVGQLRNGVVALTVESIVRTELPWADLGEISPGQNLKICVVLQEAVGGQIRASNDTSCTSRDSRITFSNPAIQIRSVDISRTVRATSAQARVRAVANDADSIILTRLNLGNCGGISQKGGENFLKIANTVYRLDARVGLQENTIERAAHQKPTSAGATCPVVRKTFTNENTCRRCPECSAATFTSATLTLNENTLRQWYTRSNKFVYVVDGLRLEAPFLDSPCANGVSRWIPVTGSCAQTSLDTNTKATLVAALRGSDDTSQTMRDINVQDVSNEAHCNEGTTLGAVVRVDGTCWQHVHPNLYDVFDYTMWAEEDQTIEDEATQGRVNPITRFAIDGLARYQVPIDQTMTEFRTLILNRVRQQSGVVRLGRLGDRVDFRDLPPRVQTLEMAQLVGATVVPSDPSSQFFEACGSAGEVANDPALGHHYRMIITTDNKAQPELRAHHLAWNGKRMAWTMNALNAQDQLRQRVAWALSQICVLADVDTDNKLLTEYWIHYYDIFVRHAFGNYRDVLREVTYHPAMSDYLTYRQNKAFAEYASSLSYPDENYAREITQLFSIGLYKLHMNGTKVLQPDGEFESTFNTDNIMSFARAWTGFDRQREDSGIRTNLESFKGQSSSNFLDPLEIIPEWRDIMPKHDLNGNFIGDGYPLCNDLPDRAFLRTGAVFKFTGLEADISLANGTPYITLSTDSALFRKLCSPRSQQCTFPPEVVLDRTLTCNGEECTVDQASMVKLTDGSTSAYYMWKRPACVSFSFYQGKQAVTRRESAICADPNSLAGGSVCCYTASNGAERMQCAARYHKEQVKWQTNVDRCNSTVTPSLDSRHEWHQCSAISNGVLDYPNCYYNNDRFLWTNHSCSIKARVDSRGFVNMVHDDTTAQIPSHFRASYQVNFFVPWASGSFPTQTGGCGTSCTAHGTDSCLCLASVSEQAAFSATSMPTSSADVLDQLKVGAGPLDMFEGNEAYRECRTRECTLINGVSIFLQGSSNAIDANTVFLVHVHGVLHYRRNTISTVSIGPHSFRNPVQFMPTHRPVDLPSFLQDATYETEAVLDHLLYHANTAPFISQLLIQRLVTSNPSARYIESVATAFQTGTYGGTTYTGRYGDLGATVAAILLDREARSAVLDLDPAWGRMHEPILKVLHLMRSMEVNTNGREVELYNMDELIGQMPFSSPSVFNYYLPDYQPAGAVRNAGLYAPEGQLGTAPFMVGFLNGIASLINNGFTNCMQGFGSPYNGDGSVAYRGQDSCSSRPLRDINHGFLTYLPEATAAAEVVAEVAMLLTGRHLSPHAAAILTRIYEESSRKLPDIDPVHGVIRPGCYYRTPNGCNSEGGRIRYTRTEFLPDMYSTNVTFRQNEQACLVDRVVELVAQCGRPGVETQFVPDDGLRKVMRLLTSSPEFHVTNHHAPTALPRPARPTVAGQGRRLKAVVVIWLTGGADSYNLLVPHSQCTNSRDLYAEYAERRGPIAQRQSDLLQINSRAGSQPCNKFGLHPTMSHFKQLYDDGDLAFIANAGSLIEPATLADYQAHTRRFPPSLFAHNIMQRAAETVHANDPSSTGVLGRLGEALQSGSQGYKTGSYSTAGNLKLVMGGTSAPKASILDPNDGVIRYDEFNEWNSTIAQLLGTNQSSSIFADTHAEILTNSLSNTELLGAVLDNVNVTTTFPSNRFGSQLRQVARVLAGKEQTGEERATFVVNRGGWDHHTSAVENMNSAMTEVNDAVEAFTTELKAQGVWDDVAIVTYSEFARTLTSNGVGTDHAWGGNYMLMGGGIRGGQILGQFPESLAEGSNVDVGRGRMLPTTSWEAIWNGLGEWMGVDSSQMDQLLPNKRNFPRSQLFSRNDFFEN